MFSVPRACSSRGLGRCLLEHVEPTERWVNLASDELQVSVDRAPRRRCLWQAVFACLRATLCSSRSSSTWKDAGTAAARWISRDLHGTTRLRANCQRNGFRSIGRREILFDRRCGWPRACRFGEYDTGWAVMDATGVPLLIYKTLDEEHDAMHPGGERQYARIWRQSKWYNTIE